MQTGFPFTVNLSGDTANVGAGTGGIFIRPNAVPGMNARLDNPTAARFFNTSAFAMPAAGTFGNVGRYGKRARPYRRRSERLRVIRINERFSLQLRGEVFNGINHPNWVQVGQIINTPATFGQALNQLDPREFQFGAKLTF